jgi:signal transduction histidine kinase
VSVEDAGRGIERSEREDAFERFYRGRGVRGGSAPGAGLGLYVCRRLVEAHGGEIWIDDRESGSSVSFTLPAIATRRGRRSRVWPEPDP